jgi:hypothetical protein
MVLPKQLACLGALRSAAEFAPAHLSPDRS